MAENIVNKLTVKTVYGTIRTILVDVTDPVSKEVVQLKALEHDEHLMRIYGQALNYRVATSQYGETSVFKGVFKAINPSTGEMFVAGECCLPKSIENQLAAILDAADGAEFAFDVWAISAKNAYGYEYRVKVVDGFETKPAPIIAAMEARMGMLQLESPKSISEQPRETNVVKAGKRAK